MCDGIGGSGRQVRYLSSCQIELLACQISGFGRSLYLQQVLSFFVYGKLCLCLFFSGGYGDGYGAGFFCRYHSVLVYGGDGFIGRDPKAAGFYGSGISPGIFVDIGIAYRRL